MSKIAILRHGVTQWNKDGIRQGFQPNPLCQEGVEQAQKVAKYLDEMRWATKEDWGLVFSSPMARTQETAWIIAKRMGFHKIFMDDRLKERDPGLTEMTTESERVKRWGLDWKTQTYLGIENDDSIRKRSVAAIKDIARNYQDCSVIIVTHGCCARLATSELSGRTGIEEPNNTALFLFDYKNGKWTLELCNSTIHLDSI